MRKSGVGNIFIKNLDKSVDSADLKDIFSSFGIIISAKIALTERGESKGYGFVQFKTKEEADAAIQNVNGLLINSKEVSVAHYIPRTQRDTKGGSENTFTNIYVKNLDKSTTDEEFRELFTKFGNITSCYLKFEPKYDSSFGFVNYETHEEAVRAIEETNNNKVFKSRELFITQALSKEDRNNKLKSSNIYVKEFDATLTEEDLRTIFGKYGDIKSVKIMKGNNNVSLGFGFICFTDAACAQNAIKDSKTANVNSIYVSIAKTKEERKRELLSARGPPARGFFPYGMPNYPPNMPIPYPMGFPPPVRGPNDMPIRPPGAPPGVPYFPQPGMVPPPGNKPPPPGNFLFYPPPLMNRKSPLTLDYLMGLPNEKRVQEVKKLFIDDIRAKLPNRDDSFYDKIYTLITKKFYPIDNGRILPALLNLYEDQQRFAIELNEALKANSSGMN